MPANLEFRKKNMLLIQIPVSIINHCTKLELNK